MQDSGNKSMIELRFHGRGGQGAKTAAQLLVEAALKEGKFIQAFPEYGPERTGAPVKAFARISSEAILTYQPILNPDYLVVIDPTLLVNPSVTEGTTENTILIINSDSPEDEIMARVPHFKGKIYPINASGIAFEKIKMDKSNVPMLGALAKVSKVVSIACLKEAVYSHFISKSKELGEANVSALEEAYSKVNA
ncbi:MAG TPA: pyruvate synthase [Candidatus Woesearchaeota archaeon]|nr:pyruvate synthase [Candidatus Woesearchaeota archaeon]